MEDDLRRLKESNVEIIDSGEFDKTIEELTNFSNSLDSITAKSKEELDKIKKEQREQLNYEKRLRSEMLRLVEAGTSELEKLEHQEMKLNNTVSVGIISWQEYEKAMAGVKKQIEAIDFAKKESELALQMTEIEAKAVGGDLSALQTAKEKVSVLQEQLNLHKERLATMAKGTAEEITAWNNEAQAMNEVSKELNEQIDIIKQYTDVWYGVKQGIKDYYDEVTNLGEQLRDTVVNSFRTMEDALAEFVRTGKLNFRSLIDSMIADLARLAAKQAMSGIM